jgi:LDH2 family malate/lactate/ureidoglycolate dehydrogenase
MGIDTHGIEALDMYVTHIREGGLRHGQLPVRRQAHGALELWDMQHGFGLASARWLMGSAIEGARKSGLCALTCCNSNHIGACGVYGKMAADQGMIGIVTQQSLAVLAPWGGREPRIGSAPFAFAAPVRDGFPFCFDASMSAMTRGRIKEYRRAGKPLPPGVAQDAEGRPTTDAEQAWFGMQLPIGAHKGIGLAMAFEILAAVLSANRASTEIPSIVNCPDRSAGSSLFMLVLMPDALGGAEPFQVRMRRYVEEIERAAPATPDTHPRYPGRRAGEHWADRSEHGIPVSAEGLRRLQQIADDLGLPRLAQIEESGM